jgi:hypothetical protein
MGAFLFPSHNYTSYAVAAYVLLCLRQHGTGQYICGSFFARTAKKRTTKRRKVPLREPYVEHRVTRVDKRQNLRDADIPQALKRAT